ncbi:MAG: 3-mercaptopyruvate sulfurtransferase [Alphaproteobacteria bacterium]
MTGAGFAALVSTDWLAANLAAPDLRVVDASWYLPTERRDPKAEYRAAHLPGAVFFDIDEIADTASPYPHMLPAPEKFSARVRKLGLGDGNRIVAYDSGSMMAAPRVWWMFRVFGHDDIAVLDGGMAKWRAEGRSIEDLAPMPRERHFTARLNNLMVRDLAQVRANIDAGREQLVDVRAAGRFKGTAPEPRPGVRSGHIPGALNLPHDRLIDAESRTFLGPDSLRRRVADAGIDLSKPIVASCGSGVSACVLALALHLIGHRNTSVYDGSWSEWGGRGDTPIAT